MHPEIVSFGPFTIRSYGLMLAFGFLAGIYFAARRAEKYGENPDHVYNLTVWIIISSIRTESLGGNLLWFMKRLTFEYEAVSTSIEKVEIGFWRAFRKVFS